jgi:ABC-type glycerol-3-phosphate transport system substrate-binding protein
MASKLEVFSIAFVAMALASTALSAAQGEFDGVTVNVMTQTGAIQEPLQRRAPEFEKLTGAKINVIAVPFSDLYQKVLTDWASGTNSVDAAVFAPQWMVDYVAGGYLEDIGARVAKKPNAQSYWFVTDVVGSMTQAKGTSQGTFFNTKDMTPLVDNAAFRKALDFLKESSKYGPPDELNMDVSDTRPLFTSGKCALNLDWGDVGVLAIDPATSKVIDKTGATIMPGSKEVLNWDTGKLEACTKDTCPYAIDGVNHAPYAAFGGWSGGINTKASDKVKDAAYAFFSYVSAPAQSNVDVTIGKTGFNPYRVSQLNYGDSWKTSGMSEKPQPFVASVLSA